MKKIIIFIFLIGAFIDQSYAQKGITAQYVYDKLYTSPVRGGGMDDRTGSGFSLGYFFYKNDKQFKQIRLTYIGSSSPEKIEHYYVPSGAIHKYFEEPVMYKHTTITFSYDKYTIWGNKEMDDPNIWYGFHGWDVSYEKSTGVEDKPGRLYFSDQELNEAFNFNLGFHAGLGYQHNFSHKIGAFVDFAAAIRFVNFGYGGSTNLGIRMNLK